MRYFVDLEINIAANCTKHQTMGFLILILTRTINVHSNEAYSLSENEQSTYVNTDGVIDGRKEFQS